MLRSQALETPLGICDLNEPDLAWLLQTSPEPVEPDLALQQGSGTFSEALLNLTWLCTKASQTFSGAFGTFSKTPLAYAVGEKHVES